MYLTRTAGIETVFMCVLNRSGDNECILPALRELKPFGLVADGAGNKCILPALRELKLKHFVVHFTCVDNVSYPHCGNLRFLFTNKKHVIRRYASARMACFLFFLFYFVDI